MSANDEVFNTLQKDIDCILNDLCPSQQLKQNVIHKIHKQQKPFRRQVKMLTMATRVAACIVVIIGVLQIPIVSAQAASVFMKLTFWVQDVTHIRVQIPDAWNAATEGIKDIFPDTIYQNEPSINNDLALELEAKNANIDVDAVIINKNKQYVYFQVSRTNDAYFIAAYRVKVPITVNDKASLLERNGPVSQADVMGSISGERITDKTKTTQAIFSVPSDYQEFEIISNVKAYKDNSSCNVLWEQNNWKFSYTGASYGINSQLKSLATAWSNIHPSVASLHGSISMVEGNKFHALIRWEQDGIQYTYSLPNNNWEEIAEVLNSFTKDRNIILK